MRATGSKWERLNHKGHYYRRRLNTNDNIKGNIISGESLASSMTSISTICEHQRETFLRALAVIFQGINGDIRGPYCHDSLYRI